MIFCFPWTMAWSINVQKKRRFYFSAIEVIVEIWEFYRVTAWGRLRLPSTVLREVVYGFLYSKLCIFKEYFNISFFYLFTWIIFKSQDMIIQSLIRFRYDKSNNGSKYIFHWKNFYRKEIHFISKCRNNLGVLKFIDTRKYTRVTFQIWQKR